MIILVSSLGWILIFHRSLKKDDNLSIDWDVVSSQRLYPSFNLRKILHHLDTVILVIEICLPPVRFESSYRYRADRYFHKVSSWKKKTVIENILSNLIRWISCQNIFSFFCANIEHVCILTFFQLSVMTRENLLRLHTTLSTLRIVVSPSVLWSSKTSSTDSESFVPPPFNSEIEVIIVSFLEICPRKG